MQEQYVVIESDHVGPIKAYGPFYRLDSVDLCCQTMALKPAPSPRGNWRPPYWVVLQPPTEAFVKGERP